MAGAHTVLDDFQKYINQYVQRKFPQFTLQLVTNQKGSTIEDLLSAGDIPDAIGTVVRTAESTP